jgi:hypothetical protein
MACYENAEPGVEAGTLLLVGAMKQTSSIAELRVDARSFCVDSAPCILAH